MGHDHEFFNSNGALRGLKRDTYEGGIRVPAIAVWKGKIKAGVVTDHQGCGQDFMPTFAELAGIESHVQSNGISFVPVLRCKKPIPREFLNWEYQEFGMEESNFQQAVRIENMKGVRYGVNSKMEIYNLENDISETHNIAGENQALVQKMEHIVKNERAYSEHYPYGGYSKIIKNE